jgi:hypothetical protein
VDDKVVKAVEKVAAEVAAVAEAVVVAVEVVVEVARRPTTCQETSGMLSVLSSNRPFEMQGTQLALGPNARWRLLTRTLVETRKQRSKKRIEREIL